MVHVHPFASHGRDGIICVHFLITKVTNRPTWDMEIWKVQCHYNELYVLCCLLIAWNDMPAGKFLWIII